MVFETKELVNAVDQLSHTLDLIADLFRHHEDMGVVLCEAAHTHKSVKLSGFLMAVNKAQLAHTQGKILVRTGF